VQLSWLYDWWKVIDEWISQNRPAASPDTQPVIAEAGEAPAAGA
jgi:hypothetical protein